MVNYRALLIGISNYECGLIPNLPFIDNDIDNLKNALESLKYNVETPLKDKLQVTSNMIRGEIFDFCKQSSTNETILIYISGHGIHYNNKDYIVPSDARTDVKNISCYLLPLSDLAKEIENARSETILFFIDACREGIEADSMGISQVVHWSQEKISLSKEKSWAFIYACSPGEVSRFVSGPAGFSLFSRALEITFKENSLMTFKELRIKLQDKLNKLTLANEKPRQLIKIHSESGGERNPFDDRYVCGNSTIVKINEINIPSLTTTMMGDEEFIKILEDDNSSKASKLNIIRMLDAIKHPKYVSLLINKLNDKDGTIRLDCENVLVKIGKPAVGPLLDIINNNDKNLKRRAIRVLGLIRDKSAAEKLIEVILSDDEENVIRRAIWALGKIGDKRAIEALLKILNDKDRDKTMRMLSAGSIGEIASDEELNDSDAYLSLINAIRDRNAGVRSWAAYALGELGDIRGIDKLSYAFKNEYDPRVKSTIQSAIIKLNRGWRGSQSRN